MSLHLLPQTDPSPDKPITGPVKKPANVRLAGVRDEPAILELLLEDLAENATGVAPVSIKRLTSLIEIATRCRGGLAPVIDGPDGLVAVAILLPDTWWWSETIFLREIVLYVTPSARNGRAGSDLIQMQKWLADCMSEAGGERVFLLAGVTGTQRVAAKLRLYGRSMTQVGGFFVYPSIDGGIAL